MPWSGEKQRRLMTSLILSLRTIGMTSWSRTGRRLSAQTVTITLKMAYVSLYSITNVLVSHHLRKNRFGISQDCWLYPSEHSFLVARVHHRAHGERKRQVRKPHDVLLTLPRVAEANGFSPGTILCEDLDALATGHLTKMTTLISTISASDEQRYAFCFFFFLVDHVHFFNPAHVRSIYFRRRFLDRRENLIINRCP